MLPHLKFIIIRALQDLLKRCIIWHIRIVLRDRSNWWTYQGKGYSDLKELMWGKIVRDSKKWQLETLHSCCWCTLHAMLTLLPREEESESCSILFWTHYRLTNGHTLWSIGCIPNHAKCNILSAPAAEATCAVCGQALVSLCQFTYSAITVLQDNEHSSINEYSWHAVTAFTRSLWVG